MANKLTEKIKRKVVDNLRKELAQALMYEENSFEVKIASFSDGTCYVAFILNPIGTEFVFFNVCYDERTGYIMQRLVEMH